MKPFKYFPESESVDDFIFDVLGKPHVALIEDNKIYEVDRSSYPTLVIGIQFNLKMVVCFGIGKVNLKRSFTQRRLGKENVI
jgi:hypothetical protein